MQQQFSRMQIVSVGVAIFAMFFGAGNLVHPLAVGMFSGDHLLVGLAGFLITSVCLPLCGLIAMILFDGNYDAFFARIGGTIPKKVAILIAMLIIGPVIAIPRIITLSHVMIAPFMPISYLQTITPGSSLLFALFFLSITFLGAFQEKGIIGLLGNIIGPLKVGLLAVIIVKGCFSGGSITFGSFADSWLTFKNGFLEGYGTLDLLGAIFFSSMTLHILKQGTPRSERSRHDLAMVGLKGSLIGAGLLALFYTGLTILGYLHGSGLARTASGALFRDIAFKVMGTGGAAIIAVTVLLACLSTSIALSAVFAEYLQRLIPVRVHFDLALLITLALCVPLSVFGLEYVLALTGGPIVRIAYPVLIVLTFCNIAYKTFGFRPVRVPVALTLILAILNYLR